MAEAPPPISLHRENAPNPTIEAARTLTINAAVQEGVKVYGRIQTAIDGGKPQPSLTPSELNLSYLGSISALPEAELLPQPINLQDKIGGVLTDRQTYVRIDQNDGTVKVVTKPTGSTSLPDGVSIAAIDAITGRKDGCYRCSINGEIYAIPEDVVLESYTINHAVDDTDGNIINALGSRSPNEQKVIKAYIAAKTGRPSAVSLTDLTDADLKEAAQENKTLLSGETVGNWAGKIAAQVRAEPDQSPETVARLQQVTALAEQIKQSATASPENISALLKIMCGPEIVAQQNALGGEIAALRQKQVIIGQQLANITEPNAVAVLKEESTENAKELKAKQTLKAKLDQAATLIDQKENNPVNQFFTRVQNGEIPATTVTQIEQLMESGDTQAMIDVILSEKLTAGMSEEDKNGLKGQLAEWQKQGLLVGGGIIVLMLFMAMQGMQQAAK